MGRQTTPLKQSLRREKSGEGINPLHYWSTLEVSNTNHIDMSSDDVPHCSPLWVSCLVGVVNMMLELPLWRSLLFCVLLMPPLCSSITSSSVEYQNFRHSSGSCVTSLIMVPYWLQVYYNPLWSGCQWVLYLCSLYEVLGVGLGGLTNPPRADRIRPKMTKRSDIYKGFLTRISD